MRLQVERIAASRTPAMRVNSRNAVGSSGAANTIFSRISTGAVRWLIPMTRKGIASGRGECRAIVGEEAINDKQVTVGTGFTVCPDSFRQGAAIVQPFFALPRPCEFPLKSLRSLFVAGIATGLVAGCTPTTPRSEAESRAELPSDPNALILGAEVALQRKQYREASEAYVRAAELSSDEALSEQATRIAYENNQWNLVIEAGRRWLT